MMAPGELEAEVDGVGAARRQLFGEPGKEGVERDLARFEQDMSVMPLRNALARLRLRRGIALVERDPVETGSQGAGRGQAGHATAEDGGMASTL
jgi:hypothetical protein